MSKQGKVHRYEAWGLFYRNTMFPQYVYMTREEIAANPYAQMGLEIRPVIVEIPEPPLK